MSEQTQVRVDLSREEAEAAVLPGFPHGGCKCPRCSARRRAFNKLRAALSSEQRSSEGCVRDGGAWWNDEEAAEVIRNLRGALVTERARTAALESALRVIRGPADSYDPFMDAYQAAGGGYQGLQAVAEAALSPADVGDE